MNDASTLRSGKGDRDENFPVASFLIHPRHRPAILAFYNFVRTADWLVIGWLPGYDDSESSSTTSAADWNPPSGTICVL